MKKKEKKANSDYAKNQKHINLSSIAKKALKYLGIFSFSVLIILNLILWYLGDSNIMITAIFYALLWLVARALINGVSLSDENRINFKLAASTLIVGLLIVELTLKYVVGCYNYNFDVPQLERLGRKYVRKQSDLRLKNYEPNTIEAHIDIGSDEYHYSHSYNSLGLRGAEPSTNITLTNIAILGDSYTKGFGAPEDSTWVFLLQQKLNAEKRFAQKIQCLNGGISGSDPFSEYIVLQDLLLKFNPKIVIVDINATDIDDVIHAGGWERYSKSNEIILKPRSWWFPFYQCSFIARYFIHATLHLNSKLLTSQQDKAESKIAITKLEHCITDDYLNLARKYHFKLIVAISPLLPELEDSCFELKPLFENLHNRSDLVVVNLYDGFRNKMNEAGLPYKSIYWPIDGHNNATGYNLWAELVKDTVLNQLAISDSLDEQNAWQVNRLQ